LAAVVVKLGPQAGRRVELTREVVIGRQDADLVLDEDPEVSRRHAMLRRSGESVVVEDLNSTNGTFVNGERVREAIAVRPGDEVMVGRTTLEIESDERADDTVLSLPLPPDQTRLAQTRSSHRPATVHEDSTEPLPHRVPGGAQQSAPSKGMWYAIGAVVLAAILGGIAYLGFADRAANGFTARATDACAAAQRSGDGVDLSSDPSRGELAHARNVRLQAFGAMKAAAESDDDVAVAGKFLSAFADTNASITRLESAIGSRRGTVGPALRNLRQDVGVERELAPTAGIAGCGGLAFR
jgi:hypothetical protein